MLLVHTTEDIVYLYHLRNLLETAGVESIIKNDRLSSISGEIPMLSCWPELWIVDDARFELAKKIVNEAKEPLVEEKSARTWVCDNCGEKHSSQFSDCWNCHGQGYKEF